MDQPGAMCACNGCLTNSAVFLVLSYFLAHRHGNMFCLYAQIVNSIVHVRVVDVACGLEA